MLKTDVSSISPMLVATLMICFSAMGCTLINLKKDVHRSLESTVIVGRINAEVPGKGPIIVAACPIHEPKTIAHYTVLHESGEYELMLNQGDYYVFAYRDKNSNLIYEAGEPAGQYGAPNRVRAPAVGVVFDIDFAIPEIGGPIVINHGTRITPVLPRILHSRQAGDITNLDDERFDEENGAKGFWEPIAFFKKFGGNVYFLEEYDPQKTPILFIHGAGGTPAGWRYFVDHIDRTRFQPWFFYYPTGARIDSMAYLLYWKLSSLQSKYQFKEIYITAHSMGGLVARAFIVNHGWQFPFVKLFISLATPWGGDKMAEYGVAQSPAVIPCWIDMQPKGDFIESLYRTKMPEDIRFYMFYGHRGSRNPFRSNNDGTILLSSLLDPRPQAEAEMNYAFNEDHASIIFSREAVARYTALLLDFDEEKRSSHHRSGGYLRVHFAYDDGFDGVRPVPKLILRSAEKEDTETVAFLNDVENGGILGPFPPGEYIASMVAMASAPRENSVPVSIESDRTNELDFLLAPDGVIRGCVTASLEPEDRFAGKPDYTYRTIDQKIDILSITLNGKGIHRVIRQKKGEAVNYYDLLISRTDFCYDTCFGFFGLPAGDYRLFINSEGYRPIVKKYSVIPGAPEYFKVTELIRD